MVNSEYILSIGLPERFHIVCKREGRNRFRTTPRILPEELKKQRCPNRLEKNARATDWEKSLGVCFQIRYILMGSEQLGI